MMDLYDLGGGTSYADQILDQLAKAVGTGDVAALVKENLELDAHLALYTQSSKNHLTLLKDIPTIQAKSIKHEFDRIDSYANDGNEAFYLQDGLPGGAKMSPFRAQTDIKLIGAINSVFALADAQEIIRTLGQNTVGDAQGVGTILWVQSKLNQALYKADTRTTRHTARFKGLFQQMDEFFSGGNAFDRGVHIIDMRGAALTPDDIRGAALTSTKQYGEIGGVYLGPDAKRALEKAMDPAERLNIPLQTEQGIIIGQNVDGMFTMSGRVLFRVDNALNPAIFQGTPLAVGSDEGPSAPAGGDIAISTQAPTVSGSLWGTADAGADIVFAVSACNLKGESTATVKAAATVAANGSLTVTITPASEATSYKIYRNVHGSTDKYCVAEVKNPNDANPIVFVDKNLVIPGTGHAYALDLRSSNFAKNDAKALELRNQPIYGNTVGLAQLMPMGIFPLANVLMTTKNDLHFIACAPQITVPRRNVVFINVGSTLP
ncbi:MAG: hypothetical protein HY816_20025 [Candidatus Wallbacteria bacterium]|nr:hypothetical protein [Candidatus Wallbacteria bacterium]